MEGRQLARFTERKRERHRNRKRGRERERERERTWSEGSQKRPVQLAGMYLLCFIDGLMFCKTRGTTVVILWAAMHFSLVVSKQCCVTGGTVCDGV